MLPPLLVASLDDDLALLTPQKALLIVADATVIRISKDLPKLALTKNDLEKLPTPHDPQSWAFWNSVPKLLH